MGPFYNADRQVAERRNVMTALNRWIKNFLQAEDGPTAVEYAVMLALIIVVCITAITALGTNANATFTSVSNSIGSTSS
jgi:pilus assembly protein Flp/PilA